MTSHRNHSAEQIDKTAEIGRKASDEANRTIRNMADEASKAGEQAAHAGDEFARRGVETLQETLQSNLNTTVQTLERMSDQFTRVISVAAPQAEALAGRSSQSFDAAWQASTILAKGAQEVSQEWLRLLQDRLARNVDVLNRLAGCRSVPDFIAIQGDVMRDRLGEAVESSRRIAEVSMRATDEATHIIQSQTARSAAEFDQNSERVRRAA